MACAVVGRELQLSHSKAAAGSMAARREDSRELMHFVCGRVLQLLEHLTQLTQA
jgi:hypothetical protein